MSERWNEVLEEIDGLEHAYGCRLLRLRRIVAAALAENPDSPVEPVKPQWDGTNHDR
jgi:hypothetical protein